MGILRFRYPCYRCVTRKSREDSSLKERAHVLPEGFKPGFGHATGWDCIAEKSKNKYVITNMRDVPSKRYPDVMQTFADLTLSKNGKTTKALLYGRDGYWGWGDDESHSPLNSIILHMPLNVDKTKGIAEENYGETLKEEITCKITSTNFEK